MDTWDITILVIGGYLAVMGLVRLMARRRNQVLDQLQQQIEEEQNHRDRFGQPPHGTKAA
jgi:hypothetical protein